MTVVTIEGIPLNYTLNRCAKLVTKVMLYEFQLLNFTPSPRKGLKALHINVIDDARLNECIHRLNGYRGKGLDLKAYVPNVQPYVNPKNKKYKQVKNRIKHLKIPQSIFLPSDKILFLTRNELVYELQDKYTALMEINRAVGNKLLHEIVQLIDARLKAVLDQAENCFMLSSKYRCKHPHTSDFDLVKTCLSKTGSKVVLTKEMLKATPVKYEPKLTDSIPLSTIQTAVNKYATAIQLQLVRYVNALPPAAQDGSVDAAARARVREQFKKLAPSMQYIVNECLSKHVLPPTTTTLLRIYGEPSLPKLASLEQLVRAHRGSMFRSPNLYNCVHAQLPSAEVAAILAADGTCIEGRNIVIRVFTKEIHKKIIRDVVAAASGRGLDAADAADADDAADDAVDGADDEAAWEDWGAEEEQ